MNLLKEDVLIGAQKHRQAKFMPFFKTEDDLTFCSDVNGLMQAMHIDYEDIDWRLFIDVSRSGLKAVLLHNDNLHIAVPVAYSRTLKETYESMNLIFDKVNYDAHKWDISGDLKVTALIKGLQLGRIKIMCFSCKWESTYKGNQYTTTWENRDAHEIGLIL